MRVHLVGVAGTGMGSLAMLFRERGDSVSGSDVSFDPPMGPALESAGIVCKRGFSPEHIPSDVDLVVVGNAIRKDNAEAVWVREKNLHATSMSGALASEFLRGRTPLVVCGTHGKTTTSTMCAWLLVAVGLEPGYFIGGIPKGLPSGAALGTAKRSLLRDAARSLPFVIEGDEYDSVYWHKAPKFLDYVGVSDRDVVIVTSIEQDHIDIYPDEASYIRAFEAMIAQIPAGGLLIADCRDVRVVAATKKATCEVVYYALSTDPGLHAGELNGVTPIWLGATVPMANGVQAFDLFGAGSSFGRFEMPSPGEHNVRNAIAALAACAQGFGADMGQLRTALARFPGVKRRQDLLGTPGGIFLYDDFAHHPTAVKETLRALRAKHPTGRLWAVFEPRSATACRALHQVEYVDAFREAEEVLFAPLGRTNIPESERLDTARLAQEIGGNAFAASSVEEIVGRILADAHAGDVIALLSNGAFSGIHQTLLTKLSQRAS